MKSLYEIIRGVLTLLAFLFLAYGFAHLFLFIIKCIVKAFSD